MSNVKAKANFTVERSELSVGRYFYLIFHDLCIPSLLDVVSSIADSWA